MIFKEKQNRILSVTVKVLNNYDNYKLKDMDKEDKNMKYAAKAWKETEGASLRNFNEQAQVDSVNGALALRPQIETIIDQIWEEGFDGIYFIGIGGTYASGKSRNIGRSTGRPSLWERPACPYRYGIRRHFRLTNSRRISQASSSNSHGTR